MAGFCSEYLYFFSISQIPFYLWTNNPSSIIFCVHVVLNYKTLDISLTQFSHSLGILVATKLLYKWSLCTQFFTCSSIISLKVSCCCLQNFSISETKISQPAISEIIDIQSLAAFTTEDVECRQSETWTLAKKRNRKCKNLWWTAHR